ncbi:unnamed protein product [Dovyalis caffra]|uniref:Uncharacterized protein n=1 Tax=Dovyalis caffra TaxID=77055 RepID=A0AAV1RVN8_9ROSI|nr:unnamed protein product [Dovyalis caffra]
MGLLEEQTWLAVSKPWMEEPKKHASGLCLELQLRRYHQLGNQTDMFDSQND